MSEPLLDVDHVGMTYRGGGWFARPAVALVRAGLLLAAAIHVAVASPSRGN